MSTKFTSLPVNKVTKRIQFTPPEGSGHLWPPVSKWGLLHWTTFLVQHGWSVQESEHYFNVDRQLYGFGLRRSPDEPFTWFYQPIPRAVDFHASKVPNLLYGGAVGGTKSTTARWDAYRQCFAIPEFTALIMRRTHQELKRNHMKFVARESKKINDFLGKEVMEWVPTEFELRFKHNGSVILFGHCQNEGDEEKYLSDEYDAFYPDEMATFTKTQILGVSSRLRSVVRGDLRLIPRLGGTSNPGGANTLWLRDWFITRNLTEEDKLDNPQYNLNEWAYLHARLYDNPYLMDPDGTFTTYENRVYARGGARAKQLLNGDWSVITGQFFKELSDTHFVKRFIPKGVRIERWIDWGYSNNGICAWVAILPSGHIHVLKEYVFRETIASKVAQTIIKETFEVLRKYPDSRIAKTIGDPAMQGPDGSSGQSYAETFQKNGVVVLEGDNQRVLGWGRLREWFSVSPDGTPWMTIDPACPYLQRTLPTLVHDKNDPEDINSKSEDHGADMLRYGVMGRPSPVVPSRSHTPPLPDSVKAMLNELAAAERSTRRFGQVM